MANSIVPGSIAAIARKDNTSIALSFMLADEIILIDVSGSMLENDSTNGQTRYDVACQELCKLQSKLSGKLAIFAFSDTTEFVPGGLPPILGGGTNMLNAIEYVKDADGTVGFTVISDGYPDPGQDSEILALVKTFKSRVNAIFAGPVEDTEGRKFMKELAKAGRGKSDFSQSANDLSRSVIALLESGK